MLTQSILASTRPLQRLPRLQQTYWKRILPASATLTPSLWTMLQRFCDEFQAWCHERGITHLTGAPYHPAMNRAAERLVRMFKQSLRKSTLSPKTALQEFLLQYHRTPLDSGYSPSKLLNGRQIWCKLDALFPFPIHAAQGKQAKEASQSQ